MTPTRPRTPRSARGDAGFLFLLAGLALLCLHAARPTGAVGQWSYLVAGSGAAAVAWIATTHALQRSLARLVALGISLSAMGDLVYQLQTWVQHDAPDVGPADLFWLGAYGALILCLLRLLRGRVERWRELDAWGDIWAVVVLSLVLQWQLTLGDILADTTVPVVARITWAMYPALDAVLIALVIRAVSIGYLRSKAGALFGAGALLWLLSDSAFSVLTPGGTELLLDLGWLGGSMAFAGAVWFGRSVPERPRRVVESLDVATPRRLAVAMVTLCIPATIEIVGYATGIDPNPIPLFLATVALVAMVYARSVLLMRAGHRARAELREQERRASLLAANSSDAAVVVDAQGTIVSDPRRVAALLGYGERDSTGMDVFGSVDPADQEAARAMLERVVAAPGQPFEVEARVHHRDGRVLWFGMRFVNLLDDPDLGGVVVNLHEITLRKQAELALEHQAFHDDLTGLANRALFTDRVGHALERSARSGDRPAVLFLDLDGFKLVNDSLGHAAGDELLRVVAQRLAAGVRSGESVARLGGDEFAVLIEPTTLVADDASVSATRLLQLVSDPIAVHGEMISITASLGIAVGDAEATAESLLRDADVAMYRAKSGGRARWMLYEPEMGAAVVERLRLESDLASALGNGELFLEYQPVVALADESVVGFEALLRWRHPTLGVLQPDRFVPVAEETGLIVPIGAWVLAEACRTGARWQRAHGDGRLSMAVNVSARQLVSEDFGPLVARVLHESGIDPSTLVVEMTETALVEDTLTATLRLNELRDLGVRVAIDDFGTGYSSLSYLRQFPVDILKIDRSFVTIITEGSPMPALVRGLLDLANTLGLEVVAEGVEMTVQRDRLRDEGCAFAQGFLFALPLGVADAERYLDRRTSSASTLSD